MILFCRSKIYKDREGCMDIVKVYEENNGLLRGHFLLSSGMHSDTYLQSEQVLQYPEIATGVISQLIPKLKHFDFTTVVSPAIGGIRFGYELSRLLSKRSIFTERVDGKMTFRRGFTLSPKEKIVIAEDVVTTGRSTKECIAAIEENGGEVVAIVSIIDRSEESPNFSQPYMSLVRVLVKSYEASNCPICTTLGTAAIKPGSR